LRDEGELLLHGHTHDKQKAHDGNMFHVGLDAWRELVPQETILDWISSTS
jgi:calcineurin-like phosphoesterase family protein